MDNKLYVNRRASLEQYLEGYIAAKHNYQQQQQPEVIDAVIEDEPLKQEIPHQYQPSKTTSRTAQISEAELERLRDDKYARMGFLVLSIGTAATLILLALSVVLNSLGLNPNPTLWFKTEQVNTQNYE